MSDIEIARKAKMQPISEILDKINVPDTPEAFSPMGRHIAKINLEYINTPITIRRNSNTLFNYVKTI